AGHRLLPHESKIGDYTEDHGHAKVKRVMKESVARIQVERELAGRGSHSEERWSDQQPIGKINGTDRSLHIGEDGPENHINQRAHARPDIKLLAAIGIQLNVAKDRVGS